MTTTLPALDSTTHVSSVTYAYTMAPTISGPVMFTVPGAVQFLFTFDTGATQPDPLVDLFNVTTDTSWFSQSTQEAAIKTALDGTCALLATMLGTTTAAVQATVTIKRTWRISPNQTGTAAPVQMPGAPVPYTETMTYP
jgi:hypothetical protein